MKTTLLLVVEHDADQGPLDPAALERAIHDEIVEPRYLRGIDIASVSVRPEPVAASPPMVPAT